MARSSSITGQIVNRATLAGILARSPATIDAMVRAGCPQISRGEGKGESEFNTAEVIKWLLARERDAARAEFDPEKAGANEGRRRFTVAAAELKELQLAKMRKSMVLVEDVVPIVEDELARVRSRLLAIAGRVMAAGPMDSFALEKAITDEVVAALSELSGPYV